MLNAHEPTRCLYWFGSQPFYADLSSPGRCLGAAGEQRAMSANGTVSVYIYLILFVIFVCRILYLHYIYNLLRSDMRNKYVQVYANIWNIGIYSMYTFIQYIYIYVYIYIHMSIWNTLKDPVNRILSDVRSGLRSSASCFTPSPSRCRPFDPPLNGAQKQKWSWNLQARAQ